MRIFVWNQKRSKQARSLIQPSNHLDWHYSQCYFAHRHRHNARYNKAHSLIGTSWLAIIASYESSLLSHCDILLLFYRDYPENFPVAMVPCNAGAGTCAKVQFRSDGSVTSTGFEIIVKLVDAGKVCIDIKVHIHWEKGNVKENVFLWSLSLLNVNIELESLWTYLKAMSLLRLLLLPHKRTFKESPTFLTFVLPVSLPIFFNDLE